MKKKKRLSIKQIGIGIVIAVVALLLIIYFSFVIYFNNHFLFRTTINGMDSSKMTVKNVEQSIIDEINNYTISINQREEKQEIIKGIDIKLKPVFDGSLNKELKKQNGFIWFTSLFSPTEIQVDTMVSYDEENLDELVKNLDAFNKNLIEKPQNAYISEYDPEKGYEIIEEVNGTQINKKEFKKVLQEGIINLKEQISLEELDCYIKPEYTKDSPEIVKLAETMNLYVNTQIIYQFGEIKEVLDKDRIHKWLHVSDDFKATINEEKLDDFVSELATNYNTAYKAKSLETAYGETVTITKGDYGYKINQDNEKEQLLEEIKTGQTVEREPKYSQRGHSFGANDYGNTYVEINLTAQHLFFYKNGNLIVESDFVSGNLSKGWGTPAGAYGITYTQRDATLRGEDYATPVDFWMPFNGGVGLHDATWRRDFGGNYYKNGGSHGCVNLPYDVAKTIFENINTGDPVLVYELPGSESTKAKAQGNAEAVIAAINSIGDISLEKKPAVTHARAMYETLNGEGKGYVANYNILLNAEAVIADLESQAAASAQEEQTPPEGEAPPEEAPPEEAPPEQ